MNATAQRRLTWVLVAICVLLIAALFATLAGAGRDAHWHKIDTSPSLPSNASMQATVVRAPQATFAETWQRPLFNPARRPAADSTTHSGTGTGTALSDFELTGVILTADLRFALVRDAAGQTLRIHEGATLPGSDWTLSALQPRRAVFTGGNGRTEVVLTSGSPGNDSATSITNPQASESGVGVNPTRSARIETLKKRIRERQRPDPPGQER